MKGKAPNWPATGSQTLVRQKRKPKARIESIESRVRRIAMPATRQGTSRATRPVPSLKARLSRERIRPASSTYLTILSASISSFTTLSGSGA